MPQKVIEFFEKKKYGGKPDLGAEIWQAVLLHFCFQDPLPKVAGISSLSKMTFHIFGQYSLSIDIYRSCATADTFALVFKL
jgi:hypothetical protein